MPEARLTFDAVFALALAAVLWLAVIAIAWRRRVSLPIASRWLAAAGLLLLVLASGSPHWRRAVAREVAVLVDLSPSTRSAAFRDRAVVERRVRDLLGATPFRIYGFAGGAAIAADHPWTEVSVPRTHLEPPAAEALLLFSDGRFDLPAASPPVYAAIDPTLQQAADGRIASLAWEGRGPVAHVEVATERQMFWNGTANAARPLTLSPGRSVQRQGRPAGSEAGAPGGVVTAGLAAGDLWPENDALAIVPPSPPRNQRWYVTRSTSAPEGYRSIAPGALPTDAADYLAASVIVLDNIPASSLTPGSLERIGQFVRDLGGGLVILGGDQAFAAGSYVGTPLDALSPLASAPPRPTTHWMLLTDGSGSMSSTAGETGPRTRWESATAALLRLLPAIPPDDPVDLGSFAGDVAWWTGRSPRSAREVATLAMPPAGVSAGGPTNLRPAIEQAARRHDPSLPGNLLLLSDADAEVGDVATLAQLLQSRKLRLHLLAVGNGRGLADLRRLVEQTSGTIVSQSDADRWADAAAELLRSASEKRLVPEPADVRFSGPLSSLPPRRVSPWNRTWLKPRAARLADTAGAATGEADGLPTALAAVWQAGEGKVAAIAFAATAGEQAALVDAVAASPRDPRFAIKVVAGSRLTIQVDAIAAAAPPEEQYLNDLPLVLELSFLGKGSSSARTVPIPQTAPGRYEVALDAPASPMVGTIRADNRAIEHIAIAGRYPREFDAIGIDRDKLRRMVDRFGGTVIEPNDPGPIDFRWPTQATPLAPWLAAAGALLIGAALLWWRWA